MRIENHCHINGFALSLVLKQRLGVTRKWPVIYQKYIIKIYYLLGNKFSFFRYLNHFSHDARRGREHGIKDVFLNFYSKKFIPGSLFFCPKVRFSWMIFALPFTTSNHQIVEKKKQNSVNFLLKLQLVSEFKFCINRGSLN